MSKWIDPLPLGRSRHKVYKYDERENKWIKTRTYCEVVAFTQESLVSGMKPGPRSTDYEVTKSWPVLKELMEKMEGSWIKPHSKHPLSFSKKTTLSLSVSLSLSLSLFLSLFISLSLSFLSHSHDSIIKPSKAASTQVFYLPLKTH